MKKLVIDLHTHILPGMDDGSDSLHTSLEMLHAFEKENVCVLCATSHYYSSRESIDSFLARRTASARLLAEHCMLEKTGGYPRIRLGAEVAFFSGISECRELEALCIEEARTLLLEMPFRKWTGMEIEEVLSLTLDRGFRLSSPIRNVTSSATVIEGRCGS